MNILISQPMAWMFYGLTFVGVFLILFLIFYFTCGFRKKRENAKKENRVTVDSAFMDKLLISLGGVDNIEGVSIDNGRVKFLVSDLDLVMSTELKTLSTNGVFITGNNVKLLFKYDAQEILHALKERGVVND